MWIVRPTLRCSDAAPRGFKPEVREIDSVNRPSRAGPRGTAIGRSLLVATTVFLISSFCATSVAAGVDVSAELPDVWTALFTAGKIPDVQRILTDADWATRHEVERPALPPGREREGWWRTITDAPFPRHSLVAIKGPWLTIFAPTSSGLRHWLSIDLRQFAATSLESSAAKARVLAQRGILYVWTTADRNGLLLIFDLRSGQVTRVTADAVETHAESLGARSSGAWRRVAPGFGPPSPLVDVSVSDSGTFQYVAIATKTPDLLVLERGRNAWFRVSLPISGEPVALSLSPRGDLALVERGRTGPDRVWIKRGFTDELSTTSPGAVRFSLFDEVHTAKMIPAATVSGAARVVHADLPVLRLDRIHADLDNQSKLRVYLASRAGPFAIVESPVKGRGPFLHFVVSNQDSKRREFGGRGHLRFLEGGTHGVGITGWSDDDYLQLVPPTPSFRQFTAGAWVYPEKPEAGTTVLFDNNFSGRSGWLAGFSDNIFLALVSKPDRKLYGPPVPPGSWTHIAVTNDGELLTLYYDGVPITTNPGTPALRTEGLILGKSFADEGLHLTSDMRIFMPFVATRAMSPRDLAAIYENQAPHLVSGFTLDRLDFASYLDGWALPPARPLALSALWATIQRHAQLLVLTVGFLLLVVFSDRAPRAAAVSALGLAITATFLAYFLAGGFGHPFRSDNYIAFNLFSTLDWRFDDLLRAARFEMFGHRRIHPLAHLIMFTQYKLLGMHHVLYHVAQFTLHVVNALLVCLLLLRLTANRRVALLGGIAFLSFYSHFDMINWTYHFFVLVSTALVLASFNLILFYLERPRPMILLGCFTCLLLAQLIYEANALVAVFVFAFFLLLWARRRAALGAARARRILVTFCVGLIAVYLVYGAIVVYEVIHSTPSPAAADAPAVRFTDLFLPSTLLRAVHDTFLFLWDPLLAKAAGLPSAVIIKDIVYQTSVRFAYGPVAFSLGIVVLLGLLALFRLRREDLPHLAVFALALISFVFIVASGRIISAPANYMRSQAHYAYFPNVLLTLVVGLLLRTKLSAGRAAVLFGTALLFLASALNLEQIRVSTQRTTDHLAELSGFLGEIQQYRALQANPHPAKLFIDFPVYHRNYSFNLGADIALDKYFERDDILTKEVRRAAYLYDRTRGIIPNALFDRRDSSETDFTIEFVTQKHRPSFTKDFTVIGNLERGLSIGFTPNGRLFLQAFGSAVEDGSSPRRFVSPQDFTIFDSYHVVIQFSDRRLYMIVNGTVVDVLGPLELDFRQFYTGRLLLGDFYRGAGEVFFSTALYVKLGAARYDTQSARVGSKVAVRWQPPWLDIKEVEY